MGAFLLAGCSASHPSASGHSATTNSSSAPSSTTASSTTTTLPGPAGGPVPTGFEPQSVTFVSDQNGWALGVAPCATGSKGTCTAVVRTRDGGSTWVGVPAPTVTVGTGQSDIDEIRFADPSDGWVFGQGALASTHDGGTTWKPVAVPGGGYVASLAAGGGYVYALVIAGNGAQPEPASLYRTPAGSDAWTQLGGTTVDNALSGLVLVHGSAAWMAVQASGGATTFRALVSGDWVARGLPCQGPSGLAITALDDQNMAIVCNSGAAAGSEPKLVYLSQNGGASWSAAGSAPMGGDSLGVAMASPTTIVISAASGASWLYASFDGGHTWTDAVQDTNGGGSPWEDLGFTDAQQGVAVEGLVGIAGASTRLLMTHDGGHTWSPVSF